MDDPSESEAKTLRVEGRGFVFGRQVVLGYPPRNRRAGAIQGVHEIGGTPYAHESIYQKLVAAMAEVARNARVGDGLQAGTQIGPLNNKMQFERVVSLVEDARRSGGRMVTGGNPRLGPGYFYEPTIVTDISDGTRLVDEEQFGPALPIMPYRDVADAVTRANATHYGLGGSIWTSDLSRGAEIASTLDCGTGWVNQHAVLDFSVPFGGAKWSGLGHELGTWGMEAYTQAHVVRIAKG